MNRTILALALFGLFAATTPAAAQRFVQTGATDAEVLVFLDRLQKAIASGDKSAVAGMAQFPLHVHERNGQRLVVTNSAQLIATFDAVFTPAIRRAILVEKPAGLLGGEGGAAISGGLVWLASRCDPANRSNCRLGIVTVNHE